MFVVMLTLFAIVLVGYGAGKLGYLGGDFDRQLSRLVINLTCPALILSSAMTGELPDRRYILPLLLISAVTYAVLTGVAFWLPRYLTKQKADEGAIGFALMFGNVGFMGYPVVASIFGHEAVFYAAVLNVVNTFAVFTIGTILITGKGEVEGGRFQKKVLYSTPMMAAYLTMLIVILRIDNIPAWISEPLTMIGNIRACCLADYRLVDVEPHGALAVRQPVSICHHRIPPDSAACRHLLSVWTAGFLQLCGQHQYGGHRHAGSYLWHHSLPKI